MSPWRIVSQYRRSDHSLADIRAHSFEVIEKAPYKTPPLYQFKPSDGSSPLRRFIALPDDNLLVLGARRTPPVIAPAANPNTNTTISICTAVGFRQLKAEDYAEAAENLQADIVVGLGDIPYGRALGSKRVEKATDRNIEWLADHIRLRNEVDGKRGRSKLFASLLPVSCANQQYYIDELTDRCANGISGLAIYSLDTLEDLPNPLHGLPRLGFTEPSSPAQILREISLGVDVVTVPFVSAATDAGIALDFTFPATPSPPNNHEAGTPLPLGIDMWLPDHAADLSPLVEGCKCYACTNHHRAYIQHLLNAKEMLAWVLLQIHNHYVLDLFFAGIRNSIGNDTFEKDIRDFEHRYESLLPEKTGQGPRVRGYQYKSEGPGEPKKNQPPFRTIDDGREKNAEGASLDLEANATDLEDQGFVEKEK